MTARRYTKSLCGVALFACALLLAALPAHATEVRGTFTLPTQVQWGKTTLPAGTYTYKVLSTGFPNLLRIAGNGISTTIIGTGWLSPTVPVRDKLTLVKTDDGYAVSEFASSKLGLIFEYAVPKSSQGTMAKKKSPSHNAKSTAQPTSGS